MLLSPRFKDGYDLRDALVDTDLDSPLMVQLEYEGGIIYEPVSNLTVRGDGTLVFTPSVYDI